MKVKVGQILACHGIFKKIASSKLPAKSAFEVLSLLEALESVASPAAQVRADCFKKYGVEDGQGNITVPSEKMDEFVAELEPVLDKDVDISAEPLTIELLSGIEITPQEAAAIKPFVKVG